MHMQRAVLHRALPSAGAARLSRAPQRQCGAPAQQPARAGAGGKRQKRKAAPPPLPVFTGEGSEYFILARKAEER
jgi:hypothetical protein